MVKLSEVLKCFLIKLYVLVIIFAVLFAGGLIKAKVAETPFVGPTSATYVSEGQVSVIVKSTNVSSITVGFMKNTSYRMVSEKFLSLVLDDVKAELNKPDGQFKDCSDKHKKLLSELSWEELKNAIKVTTPEDTSIFQISLTYVEPNIAKTLNSLYINKFESVLSSGDPDNILNTTPGIITSDKIGFIVDSDATLPKAPTSNGAVKTPYEINIIKIVLISVIAWILIVVIYDFAMGFIMNKQKAVTLVHSSIISEVEIPYSKRNKFNSKEESINEK